MHANRAVYVAELLAVKPEDKSYPRTGSLQFLEIDLLELHEHRRTCVQLQS